MRLASRRRFPDSIIRRRTSPGFRDSFGEWQAGGPVDIEFSASVQPLGTEDAELVGGTQLSARFTVYVPEPGALEAAFDDSEADRVLIDGVSFTVVESWSWRQHTKASLLRES